MTIPTTCPRCGMETASGVRFCPRCGQHLAAAPLQGQPPMPVEEPGPEVSPSADAVDRYRCRIPLRRILVMTVLSYGLYLFYWAFLTWKRYGQNTGMGISPAVEALSVAVPVYGWARLAAHVRAHRTLAQKAGAPWRVGPGWAALALAGVTALAWAPLALRLDGAVSFMDAIAFGVLGVVLVAAVAGLLWSLQRDMNGMWSQVHGKRLLDAQIWAGDVVAGLAGCLAWADTMLTILSAPYRAGV